MNPSKASSAERNLNSSLNNVQPGKTSGRDSERKQYVPDSGRGLLEESIDDSLIDYSMPYEQLVKMRKNKKEPKPLKLNSWTPKFIIPP